MGLAAVHFWEHSEECPGRLSACHEVVWPALPRKRGARLVFVLNVFFKRGFCEIKIVVDLSSSAFQFQTLTGPSRLILLPWPASGSTWTGKPRMTTPSCRYPSLTPWSSTMSNLKKKNKKKTFFKDIFSSFQKPGRDIVISILLVSPGHVLDSSNSRCVTRHWACLTIRLPCCAMPTALIPSASPSPWGHWWRPSMGTEQWGSTSPVPTVWPQQRSPRCQWTCWIHSQCTQRWGRFRKEPVKHNHLAASGSYWFPSVLSVWSTVLLHGW